MFRFTLKFDDPAHSLTAEEGVPIHLLAQALIALHEAVKPSAKSKCTLSQVRGNCYALDISTPEEDYHNNLVVVHSKIAKSDLRELHSKERAYALKLRPLLVHGIYLETYNTERKEVARIDKIQEAPAANLYHSYTSVSGKVIQIGATSEDGQSFIRIGHFPNQVSVSPEQDAKLSPFYKSRIIWARLKVTKELSTGHVRAVSLDDYRVKESGALSENLAKLRDELGQFLEGIKFDPHGRPSPDPI